VDILLLAIKEKKVCSHLFLGCCSIEFSFRDEVDLALADGFAHGTPWIIFDLLRSGDNPLLEQARLVTVEVAMQDSSR